MTKLNKSEQTSSHATIINGAVLTDGLIEALQDWQHDENSLLNAHCDAVKDTIVFIAKNLHELDYDKDTNRIFTSLGGLLESLHNFKKP